MIQRIQTVLLAVAAALNVGALFVPLWQFDNGNGREVIQGLSINAQLQDAGAQRLSFLEVPLHIGFLAMVAISSLIVLITIFQYNDRPKQIKWGLAALVLVAVEIVLLVLLTQGGPYLLSTGEAFAAKWGMLFPVLAMGLIWWAIRRIRADEKLVRSVDRIR